MKNNKKSGIDPLALRERIKI